MADITPQAPKGRQVVQSYGDGGFHVSGQRFDGSVLIFPDRTIPWPVDAPEAVTPDMVAELRDAADGLDVILFGSGAATRLMPAEAKRALREAGVSVEPMDTGAACRTYNVLVLEDRRVAAALIAV